MADRLRNVQTEAWRRMEWVHDEAELAWEAYNECLLLRSGGAGGGGVKEGVDEEGKGKGVAGVEAGGGVVDESGAADLVEKVSWLKTDWGEQELLRGAGRAGKGAAGTSSDAGASARRSTRRGATKGNAMEID
ncbi:predicted protein [Chaetomium globosum CBS 148.51]|uniref:Uncharacterized protein n=1 Tax=Chaetomium globosum (strain ATCC 6205 / CBS 148.51 / DSM 1962 / NBRC 6347 / NRRL 1970) TaxID=306901 RepID=Q2H270_CHAGB|nr:uncharacterized protein CHGG_04126 [Chaetomium globosum CBS 148.51]EAQ87507.1 predicted protein [Chaetomium globosum CBS 148.51]